MWSLRITFKGGNWYWHYSYLWGEETEPEQSEESQVHTSVEIGVNPGIPLKRDGWVSESGVVTGKNAKWRVVLRKVALTQSARTSWERTWIPFLLHLQLWNLTTSWIKLSSFIRHHSCNDVTSPRNKKDIMGFGPQITYWMKYKKKKKGINGISFVLQIFTEQFRQTPRIHNCVNFCSCFLLGAPRLMRMRVT